MAWGLRVAMARPQVLQRMPEEGGGGWHARRRTLRGMRRCLASARGNIHNSNAHIRSTLKLFFGQLLAECRRSCIRGSCRNAHGAGQHSCASAAGSKGLGTDVL